MIWLLLFISFVLAAILAVQIYWVYAIRRAQKKYLQDLKNHGRPTMWDVREVLRHGDKDLAVQLYCEVFGIDDIEKARRDVEEIGRSLKS